MIPAPLVRCLVVNACARAVARGWTVFDVDADTMSVVVNLVAAAVVAAGMYAATVGRALARLVARHHTELLDAAVAVPSVTRIEATPQLAAATDSPAVVTKPVGGRVMGWLASLVTGPLFSTALAG